MARVFISHSSRDNEAARRLKSWLNGQGFETPFLDFDKHAGIAPGADWEKTLYREIERSEALIIVQTPNWLESKWCFAEFTQARALGKAIFPIIVAPTGDAFVAPDIQALDLIKDRDGGLQQLARELTRIALDAQGGFEWDKSRPPYPGLLAFQQEDAAIFFGRDDDIRRLIERLNARRAQGGTKLIALLGASGSGKSSLLRAGVLPRIRRDRRNWIVLPPMRPQARPVDELARSITIGLGQKDWRSWRQQLEGSDVAGVLAGIASDLRIRAGANEAQILLPVDQAEELFGAAQPDESDRFLEILSVMLGDALPYLALFTQRSDFLGHLQAANKLTARFEEFSLGPLPLTRYAQIIEGPARVAGLAIEEGLVHQASADAQTEDALPLLAFALRELYDRHSEDNYLSFHEYVGLGDPKSGLTPLENAVRKAADDVIAEYKPSEDQLMALRDAFVPLMVKVNDNGEYVRRPARWDEMPAKAHPLLEKLAAARLMIIRQEGDARMIEVAHEALLRKWPRLRGWLDEAREFLAGKQQLERDLHDWERAPVSDKTAALLSGLKLNRARGWMAERPHQLATNERAFVQSSIDHADALAERENRRRRNQTRAAVAASVILAAAAGVAGWQWFKAQESEQAMEVALISAQVSQKAEKEAAQKAKASEKAQREAAKAAYDAAEREKKAAAAAKKAAVDAQNARDRAEMSEKEARKAEQRAYDAAAKERQAAAALTKAARDRAVELSRYVWQDLAAKQQEVERLQRVANQNGIEADQLVPKVLEQKQPDGFDCKTWLESGFRHLYCSVRGIINFQKAQSIAGLKIFKSGPHGNELNLKTHAEFGHYNPKFLEWLDDFVIPSGMDDPRFNNITRIVYRTHIGPTARALYHAHLILFSSQAEQEKFATYYSHPRDVHNARLASREINTAGFGDAPIPFDKVRARYIDDLKKDNVAARARKGDDIGEQFRWLSDYLGNAVQDDWYLANTAGGFWVRRSIDGTEPKIFALLQKVLKTFEPEVLSNEIPKPVGPYKMP